jgi:hypothetical protein
VCDTTEAIKEAFLDYYVKLLGTETPVTQKICLEVVAQGNVVSADQANALMVPFSREEVKSALFSIPGIKAPGPDGYNSTFFKKSWAVIGEDVIEAILQFFENGKLLKQVNCTTLTLIPKISSPVSVLDFRPIACCNVIYKCITKLLCSRLRLVLPSLVSLNQTGFIEGRQIIHNICIIQDIVAKYRRKNAPKSCLLKVDIRKAYDSVSWEFLDDMLKALNFPDHFRKLVMTCVTTPSFSLCIDGSLDGFFKGKKGLRQGDPMSPLLFVLCMESLSRLLHTLAGSKKFRFHSRCRALKLNHLVFADDLIMFCQGDKESIMLMLRCLATFSACSGLVANSGKSNIYCSNMPIEDQNAMVTASGFQLDQLPFQYLGINISSKKLSRDDCQVLVEKMTARVSSWSSRTLSYRGRTQLINSVLLTLHTYWAAIFIIPKCVLKQIEAMCRNFLWDGKLLYSRPPPVAWDIICRPKKEGGLGVHDCFTWNIAAIGKQVWNIASKQDSMWLRWINHLYIKNKHWKRVPCPISFR